MMHQQVESGQTVMRHLELSTFPGMTVVFALVDFTSWSSSLWPLAPGYADSVLRINGWRWWCPRPPLWRSERKDRPTTRWCAGDVAWTWLAALSGWLFMLALGGYT
jgi:hypothetical protein